MTQAQLTFASFEDYLAWSSLPENTLDDRFELIDGLLTTVPPESGLNDAIANRIFFLLVAAGIAPLELVRPGKCEVQVPVLKPKDAANRFPDVVVLRPEHLPLIQKRLTITLDMPPPRMIAEVVSPGKQNRERDLIRKRDQYAALGTAEYWVIDPEEQTVTVLQWQDGSYGKVCVVRGSDRLQSPEFPTLKLTAEQVFGT